MSDKLRERTERMVKQLRGAGQADIADHMEQLYAFRPVAASLQARIDELEAELDGLSERCWEAESVAMNERWMRNVNTDKVHLMRHVITLTRMTSRCGWSEHKYWLDEVRIRPSLFLGKSHQMVCRKCEASFLRSESDND